MDRNLEEYPEDYPCNDCAFVDGCDIWEGSFCCTLCHYNGLEHCDSCDPWDI